MNLMMVLNDIFLTGPVLVSYPATIHLSSKKPLSTLPSRNGEFLRLFFVERFTQLCRNMWRNSWTSILAILARDTLSNVSGKPLVQLLRYSIYLTLDHKQDHHSTAHQALPWAHRRTYLLASWTWRLAFFTKYPLFVRLQEQISGALQRRPGEIWKVWYYERHSNIQLFRFQQRKLPHLKYFAANRHCQDYGWISGSRRVRHQARRVAQVIPFRQYGACPVDYGRREGLFPR